MPSGVLLLVIACVVTLRPRARFFGTGMLFCIVVVAIFVSPSPLDLPDFCAVKIDAQRRWQVG